MNLVYLKTASAAAAAAASQQRNGVQCSAAPLAAFVLGAHLLIHGGRTCSCRSSCRVDLVWGCGSCFGVCGGIASALRATCFATGFVHRLVSVGVGVGFQPVAACKLRPQAESTLNRSLANTRGWLAGWLHAQRLTHACGPTLHGCTCASGAVVTAHVAVCCMLVARLPRLLRASKLPRASPGAT